VEEEEEEAAEEEEEAHQDLGPLSPHLPRWDKPRSTQK
jgi:hypothetical protein